MLMPNARIKPDSKAARNLMEAVVLTVKASYVASRMFNNHKQQVHLDLEL